MRPSKFPLPENQRVYRLPVPGQAFIQLWNIQANFSNNDTEQYVAFKKSQPILHIHSF